ncbi:hypothetical protein [Alienimonas californiensis]|uniref:Lipoprotein n=1 Tax=Alienimonas californiensis TaxID=2527989 RepID=A0A517P9K7_9PLAN|nr:hypothetical protein [Alienimonas californiensis]QDT16066.1 hypothetical protein CA12_21640 [Alienimonas californiensis]
MPRSRRCAVRESFAVRTLCSFPACVAVTSFAALLAGCGAKEEPPAPVESGSAVGAATGRPVRIAAAGDAVKLRASGLRRSETDGNAGRGTVDGVEEEAPTLIDRLPGTYTRESYGLRTLTVHADGTATMTVDVDPFYQFLAGAKRITVQIDWTLTGDRNAEKPGVHFESVSGTPKEAFESMSKLFGSERDWVVQSADEALVLYNPKDDETEIWTRTGGGSNGAADSGGAG